MATWFTVQGITPAIFLPGPASPKTAPAKMLSRVAHCERLRTEASSLLLMGLSSVTWFCDGNFGPCRQNTALIF